MDAGHSSIIAAWSIATLRINSATAEAASPGLDCRMRCDPRTRAIQMSGLSPVSSCNDLPLHAVIGRSNVQDRNAHLAEFRCSVAGENGPESIRHHGRLHRPDCCLEPLHQVW